MNSFGKALGGSLYRKTPDQPPPAAVMFITILISIINFIIISITITISISIIIIITNIIIVIISTISIIIIVIITVIIPSPYIYKLPINRPRRPLCR